MVRISLVGLVLTAEPLIQDRLNQYFELMQNINNKGGRNRLVYSSGKLMAMAKRVIVMERFGKMLPQIDRFIEEIKNKNMVTNEGK